MPFTERQQSLINKCKKAGYGWAKFAASVEASGSCSTKQEDTLCSMTQRISIAQQRRETVRKFGWVGSDWDEHSLDAQSAGYESNDY